MQWSGFKLITGEQLWGPIGNSTSFQYYSSSVQSYNDGAYSTAYGNLYVAGFGGIVYCYDTINGNLKWTFGNGGSGNSTQGGIEAAWPNRPTLIAAIADGKIYVFNNEHSPNSPQDKDAKLRCLNATTGSEIWDILSWDSSGQFYSQGGAIADGYLAYQNTYDGKVYCIGKGPSATTTEVQQFGSSMAIRGTVTDIAAGAKQTEQAGRFPNGVPAVSDESQSAWMQYIYMQKPSPANVTGIPVTISVIDANGNYRIIGTTTSDSDGFFSLNWKPDIEGKYKVDTSFGGSESYYPSHAVTAFYVDSAAATPSPAPIATQSMADSYLLPSVVAIIVAIAVVGVVLALLVKKKRP